ncbi:MAG: putative methyltransferase [Pseudomonadota bacterium]|jgi:16S rRNA (guanine(966)-N(2))-methyltransferase RsmD
MVKSKTAPRFNQVRLQAGKYRGSILYLGEAAEHSQAVALRPTPARLRETVFNWLGQNLDGLTCLDLFAGSGIMGCESASRGASAVTLVEANSTVAQQLRKNLARLQLHECTVWQGRAEDFVMHCPSAYDLVLCDPPYALASQFSGNSKLRQVVKSNGWLYFEAGHEINAITGFTRVKYTQVGQAHGHLFLAD